MYTVKYINIIFLYGRFYFKKQQNTLATIIYKIYITHHHIEHKHNYNYNKEYKYYK